MLEGDLRVLEGGHDVLEGDVRVLEGPRGAYRSVDGEDWSRVELPRGGLLNPCEEHLR